MVSRSLQAIAAIPVRALRQRFRDALAGFGRQVGDWLSVVNRDRHPKLDASPQKSDLLEVPVAPGADQPVQPEFEIFSHAKPSIH